MTRQNRRLGVNGDPDAGFTLLEILVVVVVLGILAAMVVFAIGGVEDKGNHSACASDSRAVDYAVQVLVTENPGAVPTTSTNWRLGLLPGSTLVDAPYLQSWPTTLHYSVSVAGTSAPSTTGDVPPISPANGDVIVTAAGKSYDFSRSPTAACANT